MDENLILENGIVEGKVDLKAKISDKIVDLWLESLTDDDLENIIKQIDEFGMETCNKWIEKDGKEIKIESKKIKETYYKNWHDNKTPLWEEVQNKFKNKFVDQLNEKIDEILNSEKYKKHVDELAEEIINYATEGYKNDMITRIRERMVGNVFDASPQYCGYNLENIIRQTIEEYLPRQNY